jgi:predicted transcriptional regulator
VRTTVTLDPDIAARLHKLATERDASFKETINATLRAGLNAADNVATPYQEATHSLGVRAGIDLSKALRLAAEIEDEETIRKLDLRK